MPAIFYLLDGCAVPAGQGFCPACVSALVLVVRRIVAKNSSVILNSFQDPCANSGHASVARGSSDRAWMLKQVQHDGVGKAPGLAKISRSQEHGNQSDNTRSSNNPKASVEA
jgi:hypothetical protein